MNEDSFTLLEEAKRVIRVETDSLGLLESRINDDFITAVHLIAVSKKVIVSGIGKSGIIAKKISGTFASLGIPSVFLHPVEALHGDIGIAESGDTAILLSKSGSTGEILNLVPYLKGRGVKIIAITGNLASYLSRTADITLDGSVETEACPFNIAPTSSAIVALALGDAMAICTMKLKGITVEDFSRQHPLGQIGRNITLQVKDIMHSGEYLPLVNINSDFREAIIEISNKGLGCVCVVNDENILKGIVTDGDIRRVLQNQNEISGLKTADVMTVSPVTIDENSYLGDALTLMESRDSQIAVLPVADSAGICKGVVRIHDIVRSGI